VIRHFTLERRDEAARLLPFVCLFPGASCGQWLITEISVRPEGSRWATLWYRVHTPTGIFRVKQFFLDFMEPTYPDTCIYQAQGECHSVENITFWRGTNYKHRDSYVLSMWKTQVEISIDVGFVPPEKMAHFILSLQPHDPAEARKTVAKPFHELSFHARTGLGHGEISRCRRWTSPDEADVEPLTPSLPGSWELESVGTGKNETQYVYWDPSTAMYALWAIRSQDGSYYPADSWTRNYSSPVSVNGYEVYLHPARGTVVHERQKESSLAYVFRGLPTTTPRDVMQMFGLPPL
jgi:hypothetical protein